jgi:hypothetical protein
MAFLLGKPEILHKIVLEVRYRLGFAYLDRCGRIINTILRNEPEWLVRADADTLSTASLVSLRNSCVFTFGPQSCGLGLEKAPGEGGLNDDDIKSFLDQTELLCSITFDQLGISEFSRLGFRSWTMFGCANREEAEAWVMNLGIFRPSDRVAEAFGGRITGGAASLEIESTDRKYRITINSVERSMQVDLGEAILSVPARQLSKDQDKVLRQQIAAKHRKIENPEFAGMIDIDTFQEDPLSPEPREFIESTLANGAISKIQGIVDHQHPGRKG